MAIVTLLPRLDSRAVKALTDQYLKEGIPDDFISNDTVKYASSGGSRITDHTLRSIRNSVLAVCTKYGFPDSFSKSDRGYLESELAEVFSKAFSGSTADALRNDCWAFIATVLLPDVVSWRFSHIKRERFEGGIRNAFQRIYMRSISLDRGPSHHDQWGLIRDLSEDALVQITERPSIGANPVIARNVAEGWLRAVKLYGSSSMESRMREAIIKLRINNVMQLFPFLTSEEQKELIDYVFKS